MCPSILLAAVLALASIPAVATPPPLPLSPAPPLAGVGRWLVDDTGRVVMLHGMNDVAKNPPYYSAADGFGEDDVAFLVAEGFNALRLGVDMRGLMPFPGEVDETYLEHLATTVAQCAAAGIFVLLDLHQDGYAPKYNGNGFPDWMAIDDGLPNPPDAVFPLYYIQNPAMQRAFEHFWQNTPIPGGLGLQDYFAQALQRIATRFGTEPMVIGTELMNEPWPGAAWQPCVFDPAGCFATEAERLMPFYRKGAAALRAIAPAQLVFVEPFVLFNFGQAPTSIPGPDDRLALSFHSYALDITGELNVARYGAEAAVRDGAPVILTEFGSSTDPVLLNRLTSQFESQMLPWMFWAYGQIVRDKHVPLTPAAIQSQAALDALVRPYPVATAGVPTRIAFDPATKLFELDYTTAPAAGGTFPRRLDTAIFIPKRHYPNGYTVKGRGARVRSKPCATQLRLRTRRPGRPVSVRITSGLSGPDARRGCGVGM